MEALVDDLAVVGVGQRLDGVLHGRQRRVHGGRMVALLLDVGGRASQDRRRGDASVLPRLIELETGGRPIDGDEASGP